MKFRPILHALLLLAAQPACHAQAERNGAVALAEGLWEVAEMHYRAALDAPDLPTATRSRLTLRLAETLIRGDNPAEARDLLEGTVVASEPATPFWQALALAGLGRFSEAADRLEDFLAKPGAPHRRESAFTAASLRLALGAPDRALSDLDRLAADADAAVADRARLFQVEILLDGKRPAEARLAMPDAAAAPLGSKPLADFLEARLLLAEGNPAAARAGFQALVNQPQGQTLERYQAAAIGLADATAADGETRTAALALLDFIYDQPESPMLDAMFERIWQWLPQKPEATDPILERVAAWISPPSLPASGGPVATADSAAAPAWPAIAEDGGQSELAAFAIYTRAIGLHRIGTPEALAGALRLLRRLRIDFPDHFLAYRGLYQMARWSLEDGDSERAFSLLETLRAAARLPEMKGRAAFLQARVACDDGRPKEAVRLFDEAADLLESGQARIARLDAAVARLRSGGMTTTQNEKAPVDKSLAADLALERALTARPAAAERAALEDFLRDHPEHPRAAEARLAVAETALEGPRPDLAAARAQVAALAENPAGAAAVFAARLALVRLRIADLAGNPAEAMAIARDIMKDFPNEPEAAEAALALGKDLYDAGDYNAARLVLDRPVAAGDSPARTQAALLLAARAAALGGTPQSKEEALGLFGKAIATGGPLEAIARLELARHLIDLYRLPEAVDFLTKWSATLSKDDPLHLPAGLLLGEALYGQGGANPDSLAAALAIYDQLLPLAKDRPALANRLHYLRGTVLEKLPEKGDPAKMREKEAFQAYHSVLETDGPPAEWEFFEKCGFRALALLEKAGRWPAAIAVAKKIASFNGPAAKDAADIAGELQLKHHIWED